MGRQLHPLFMLFIGLATFGFVYQLITRPLGLLYDFLFFAAVILIFFGIYHYFFKQNRPKLNKQHQNPASSGRFAPQNQKQPSFLSKVNQNMKQTSIKEKEKSKPKKRRSATKDHPFQVIEGNKGKKKKPYSS
jgi:glucan phosphoethanolaminetransferase (alkaline phosphatase superfamily)